MSGSIWNSESSRAWHAGRRDAQNFRNANDPMRGQPVPQERQIRRRQPPRSSEAVRDPRGIYRCLPGDPSSFALEKIANHENLALIWQRLRALGGPAPGVDGLTFDRSLSEVFKLLRNTSQAIRSRRYVPAPTRPVRVKKPTGGYRTLELPSIIDRDVGAALVESLRVVLMGRLPRHYGSGASCHAILARMKIYAEDHGWNWLGVDDIQNFYPSIPRALAMDCFMREADRWNVPGLALVQQGIPWLIRQLIYGNEQESRTVGLSQGSTFSPLAASLVLLEVLDSVMDNRAENRTIMHRHVDNIHIQGLDRSEVRSAMEGAQSILLQHGMRLKDGNAQPIDVRRTTDQTILGVTTRWKNDRLLFDIPNVTWKRLEERLYETTTGSGTDNARSVIWGFIAAFRPTFGVKADNTADRIHSLMQRGGTYRIRKDTISERITTARLKWETELEHIRNPQTIQLPEQYQIELSEWDTEPWDGITAPF